MIILNQDFFSNFAGSIKSKDTGLTRDLFLNELSDIIAYGEKEVIALLNKSGVPTKEKTPDDKLVDKLIDNLPTNEKLQRGIAYMIADNHDLLKIRVVNKKGKKEPAGKEVYIAIIDKIYEGMQPTMKSLMVKEEKERIKQQVKTSVKNKVKTSGIIKENNKFRVPKWAWYVGGGLVLAGGSFLLWKYVIKKKLALKKMNAGGTMAAPAPAPQITPPAPAAPPAPAIPVPSVATAPAAGV